MSDWTISGTLVLVSSNQSNSPHPLFREFVRTSKEFEIEN